MAGDVTVAVVSAALHDEDGGTTDFVKSGFGTPKACIIIVTDDANDDTSTTVESRVSIGFSDFSSDFCISHQDEDAQTKVDCDALKSNTKSYVILTAAAAVEYSGNASTGVANGVRLTHTTGESPTQSSIATVIMFGGADLIVSLDRPSVNSSQDGTTVVTPGNALDADLVFFIGSDISGEDSASSGIENSFGVAHIDTSNHTTFVNRCMGWSSDHNATTSDAGTILHNNQCLGMLTETGSEDWGLELTAATSIASRSFSYTVTTRFTGAGANMECYALALDLDDRGSKIGSVDSPTGGATWTPSVSLGFTPQYVGLGITRIDSENSDNPTGARGVNGISSNTGSGEEKFHGWYNDSGIGTTDTNNNFRSRVIDTRTEDVATVIQDHSHSSFNSGDWTYTINTENETTGRKWFYWAIEAAGVSATTKTKTLSADSLLKKQDILKTLSADALLAKLGIEKTLSADALLVKTTLLTLSADSLLQKTVSLTTLADALLQKQGVTKTLSADALVIKVIEKTLSADALLQKTLTKTLSADALLQKLGVTLTTSADALLQKAGITKTLSADAVLLKNVIVTLSADALLQKTIAKTLSADALLKLLGVTKTLSADALLQLQDITVTTSADALLQKLIALTTVADALLKKEGVTLTASADAVLQSLGNLTLVADALLQLQGIEVTVSADALLQKALTKTLSADALLQLRRTLTFSTDALLQKQNVLLTLSADAVLNAAVAALKKHRGFLQNVGKMMK